MSILSQIDPKVKEILSQGVLSGMKKGVLDASTDKSYTVGIGFDIKQRVINARVQYALKNAIVAARLEFLSVKTAEHSTGHTLEITHNRFHIYPKRVDYKSQEWNDEAGYHKELITRNPTLQGDLFNITDTDNPVFVQLLFGKNKKSFFALLRIPDSSGGTYYEEELILQPTDTLVKEEKINTPKKLTIRTKKVSGQ
jgi:hypothetical protein